MRCLALWSTLSFSGLLVKKPTKAIYLCIIYCWAITQNITSCYRLSLSICLILYNFKNILSDGKVGTEINSGSQQM